MFRPWRARPRLSRRRWLAVGLLLMLLLCGGGYLGLQFHQRSVAASPMNQTICVALETAPRIRFGVYWTAPIFSSVPSLLFAPMQTCIELPYEPGRGRPIWLPREWLIIG